MSAAPGPTAAPVAQGSAPIDVTTACPLCHTVAPVARSGDGDWDCVTCGQHWSVLALETAASYAVFAAAHPRQTRKFEVAGTSR